jgi:predicted TPR repeat methyltransferase
MGAKVVESSMTSDRLGDVHHSAGDLAAACRAWTHALRIFDEVRAKLHASSMTVTAVL